MNSPTFQMMLLNKYLNYFESLTNTDPEIYHAGGIEYWRRMIFSRFLSIIVPLGLVVVVPSLFACAKSGLYILGIIDFLTMVNMMAIALRKDISIKLRTTLFIVSFYILAIALLLYMGNIGPGYIYFTGISIATTLIVSHKYGFYSVLFNAVIMTGYMIAGHFDLITMADHEKYDLSSHLIIGLNFLFVNFYLVAAISYFVRGLENTLVQDRFLKKKAQESDRLKSAFIANISHEIRTPLNAILGFTSLAFDEDYNEEERRRFADNVQNSGNQLLSIINSILDISVIESGQMVLNRSHFELSALINECGIQINGLKRSNDISILIKPGEPLWLYTDRTKLTQIIMNFLTNALKFTQKGSVTLGYTSAGNEVTLFVKDTGIGIPEDVGEQIFSRFFKVHNSSHIKTGTGLGLAISKAIVEAMEGKIWYQSTLGMGTTFYIRIPVVTPP